MQSFFLVIIESFRNVAWLFAITQHAVGAEIQDFFWRKTVAGKLRANEKKKMKRRTPTKRREEKPIRWRFVKIVNRQWQNMRMSQTRQYP